MDDTIAADHETRISRLEYWRNGNGTKGAAQRIEEHEVRIDNIDLHHAKEESMIQKAVESAMAKRSKSVEGYIRAFGPYFAAIASIIIAIFATGA